jgi:hypothetical protein
MHQGPKEPGPVPLYGCRLSRSKHLGVWQYYAKHCVFGRFEGCFRKKEYIPLKFVPTHTIHSYGDPTECSPVKRSFKKYSEKTLFLSDRFPLSSLIISKKIVINTNMKNDDLYSVILSQSVNGGGS